MSVLGFIAAFLLLVIGCLSLAGVVAHMFGWRDKQDSEIDRLRKGGAL